MFKSDNSFSNLQSVRMFEWLMRYISWYVLSQKWTKTVLEERNSSFNSILWNWAHFAVKKSRPRAKITTI